MALLQWPGLMKVLWCSGAILSFCSQNSEADIQDLIPSRTPPIQHYDKRLQTQLKDKSRVGKIIVKKQP